MQLTDDQYEHVRARIKHLDHRGDDHDYDAYLDDVYDRTIDAIVNERFDNERLRVIYDTAALHLVADDDDDVESELDDAYHQLNDYPGSVNDVSPVDWVHRDRLIYQYVVAHARDLGADAHLNYVAARSHLIAWDDTHPASHPVT